MNGKAKKASTKAITTSAPKLAKAQAKKIRKAPAQAAKTEWSTAAVLTGALEAAVHLHDLIELYHWLKPVFDGLFQQFSRQTQHTLDSAKTVEDPIKRNLLLKSLYDDMALYVQLAQALKAKAAEMAESGQKLSARQTKAFTNSLIESLQGLPQGDASKVSQAIVFRAVLSLLVPGKPTAKRRSKL